jgi:3-deoxy-D-manno-octulosonate 8-phosphate phosphatase KdsC-like HAD superfamily phosphatase
LLSKTKISEAIIFDAVCTAKIEEICDLCEEEIKSQFLKEGFYTNYRYSPGYGDLNIDLNESIRIGDDLNDLPMFLDEGVNVAVKNAFPKLKEHADYITDSCENSGVSKVIDKILNNEL